MDRLDRWNCKKCKVHFNSEKAWDLHMVKCYMNTSDEDNRAANQLTKLRVILKKKQEAAAGGNVENANGGAEAVEGRGSVTVHGAPGGGVDGASGSRGGAAAAGGNVENANGGAEAVEGRGSVTVHGALGGGVDGASGSRGGAADGAPATQV